MSAKIATSPCGEGRNIGAYREKAGKGPSYAAPAEPRGSAWKFFEEGK